MMNKYLASLTAWALLCIAPPLAAQHTQFFGGAYVPEPAECVSNAQKVEIWQQIELNRTLLKLQGKLQPADEKTIVLFNWPLKLKAGITDPSYYAISNYVDENPAPGLLEYNCGARTYNGHNGTDIYTWPLPWRKQANNEVEVIAGAAGTIIYRQEANADQSCATNNQPWNAVYIQHTDGSVAWYGHLKKYSLTTKTLGQTVAQGEYLGVVGSAGNSTGPHLHFEVYNSSNTVIDPWGGTCNNLGGQSWWAVQKPYYDPYILKIAVHNKTPSITNCMPETYTESSVIYQGEDSYFAGYFRDQQPATGTVFTVKRPNGTTYATYTINFTSYYSTSWWYLIYNIPANEALGTWKFVVTYNGQTVQKNFTVRSRLAITPELTSVGATAGTATFNIAATGAWSVAENATWATVTPSSGSGNGSVTVNYAAQTSASASRTVRLMFTRGTDVRNAFLTQGSTNGVSCGYVTTATVLGIMNDAATLWWTPVMGATGYEVQFRPSSGGAWASAGTTTANFTTVGNLTPSTAYTIRVRTVCGAGKSAYVTKTFNTTAFGPDQPADAIALAGSENVSGKMLAYPNPATQRVILALPESAIAEEDFDVFCFHLTGSLALHWEGVLAENNSLELDVQTLSPGFYVLQCRGAESGQVFVAKVEVGRF